MIARESDHDLRIHQHTPVPIWMPDPGVPLVARVLAFIFALALIFAIWRTITVTRPPDIPAVPQAWESVTLASGMTVPYPEDWHVEKQSAREGETLRVVLYPESPVEVVMMVLPNPHGLKPTEQPALQQALLCLPKVYPAYQESGALPGFDQAEYAIRFAAQGYTLDHHRIPVEGLWVVHEVGSYTIFLVGSAPRDGWMPMEQVMRHMLDGTILHTKNAALPNPRQ